MFTIATMAEALRVESVDPIESLRKAGVRPGDLSSPTARISLNQVLLFYRDALRRAPDWRFGGAPRGVSAS